MAVKIPDAALLDELRRLADELGHSPRVVDMAAEGAYSPATCKTRFGSWAAAVDAAGLEPYEQDRGEIPDMALFDELRRLADELGGSPSACDMQAAGAHSPTTYTDRFGSWDGALAAAGLEPNDGKNIPTTELLDELRRVASVLGRTPTQDEACAEGAPSATTYQTRFGSWDDALAAAGLEPRPVHQGVPPTELLDELRRLADELGGTPSGSDMTAEGAYSATTYANNFGSWNMAVLAAGLEPYAYPTGEDNPQWRGGHSVYYGPSWEGQRHRALERDGRKCRLCGLTDADHVDEYGGGVHVHHIQPFRDFHDGAGAWHNHEAANRLGNLVTVCVVCHRRWEGVPVFPNAPEAVATDGGERP